MSYILEALRRADAERSQTSGAAPSDLTAESPGLGRVPSRRFRAATGVGLGLIALAAALAGWWAIGGKTADAPTPTRPAVSEVAVSPPAVAEPPDATRAPPTEAPPPPPAPRGGPPATGAASPILSPEPPPTQRPGSPGERSGATPPARGPAAPATPAAPAAPATVPAQTAPATPSPPPASTAASVQGLKVTGATYSDNPAHRMLIVNGRVVLEGQEVEPGLTLEAITPHSAVLNRQGARFNINY